MSAAACASTARSGASARYSRGYGFVTWPKLSATVAPLSVTVPVVDRLLERRVEQERPVAIEREIRLVAPRRGLQHRHFMPLGRGVRARGPVTVNDASRPFWNLSSAPIASIERSYVAGRGIDLGAHVELLPLLLAACARARAAPRTARTAASAATRPPRGSSRRSSTPAPSRARRASARGSARPARSRRISCAGGGFIFVAT